ncbi:hypothetical protein TPADAL_0989a [Treponema pallidum subsp. pallidum DAL-1]|uniref:Uncharacterized protein n=2 Tax=Treponema pallidum TaxID=160 RepID=A0AAU8RRE8_TREPL|nr:hypothetical protein TPESAMD_0989a [Treponema pallidum subsp. pertenue str. SamoaD]AEZ59199.1 hypothetical protein TPECDC2_0989a [Treponema pallidum subsp. pertenue str. CDC2]AEZ60267.1 hypothetical protein TPEGAU_0989a [Treponema pallidum subsp. pertenue str. Gauthier]AEZ61326.1 hypothetical protein TPADAL_0989a [Treponema pallidum subsp. pallidum DAL-1]AGK84650.1 hypothetical protein TPFB_0989a [Treponema pallidum str. Fribourg-Blanc]AJB41027.1 hypothetical protein TENDBA_0989a [Treponema
MTPSAHPLIEFLDPPRQSAPPRTHPHTTGPGELAKARHTRNPYRAQLRDMHAHAKGKPVLLADFTPPQKKPIRGRGV